MTKIVLVETVSIFRHIYAVELNDDEPNECALDTVTMQEKGLDEFAQKHISEDIFSHRVVTEEEYLKVFDQENSYLNSWSDEQKKKFIYKEVNLPYPPDSFTIEQLKEAIKKVLEDNEK